MLQLIHIEEVEVPGRLDRPATKVMTPAPIPSIVGVIKKMIFCSTEPEAMISTAKEGEYLEL